MWPNNPAISWLEGFISDCLGVPFNLKLLTTDQISLSISGSDKCITVICCGGYFPLGSSDVPCTFWNGDLGLAIPDIKALPLIGCLTKPDQLISRVQNGYQLNYDVLGLIYWCLTRSEEVGRSDLDAIGRFPAQASHAYAHGYLHRPIVDEWMLVLRQLIQALWPTLELKRSEFSVQLSHDIDIPTRYGFSSPSRFLKSVAADLLIRKNLRAAIRAPLLVFGRRERLHPRDPLNTFDWIMDRSEECGFKSTFNFICGRTNPQRDALYDLGHPAIRDLIRRIHSRGHEIGLHPSFETYLNPELIAKEALYLKQVCDEEGVIQDVWGGRMHYLRWRQPETMQAWEYAGMDYDSTLGYPETPGFRCGTCLEFQAFDPVAKEALSLRIRPLVAMDVSVLAEEYLGLGAEGAALAAFQKVIVSCRRVGGTFSLLWHNSQLEKACDRALYVEVLDSLES